MHVHHVSVIKGPTCVVPWVFMSEVEIRVIGSNRASAQCAALAQCSADGGVRQDGGQISASPETAAEERGRARAGPLSRPESE